MKLAPHTLPAVPFVAALLLGGCVYRDWQLPSDAQGGAADQSAGGAGAGAGAPSAGQGSSSKAGAAGNGAGGSPLGAAGSISLGLGGNATGDAGSSSEAGGSAEAGATNAGPACDLSAPFGKPVALRFEVNRDRTDGRLSSDERTLYYHAYDGIWVATRPTRDAAFDSDHAMLAEPAVILMLPNVTADGSRLYYVVMVTPPEWSEVLPGWYVSERGGAGDAQFQAGQLVPDSNPNDGSLFMSPNGNHAYFIRDSQIWTATRSGTGFSAAKQLTSLFVPNRFQLMPVVNADERLIYFGVTEGDANYDIYKATWNDETAEFENAELVNELNGPAPELPDWLSVDGCRLYIHRYDKDWNYPQLMVASKPAVSH